MRGSLRALSSSLMTTVREYFLVKEVGNPHPFHAFLAYHQDAHEMVWFRKDAPKFWYWRENVLVIGKA